MIEQPILDIFKIPPIILVTAQCGIYYKQLDNQMQR